MLWKCLLSFAVSTAAATMLAAGPAAADSGQWMPLEIGAHKTFVHRQDRTLRSHGESLGDERWVGTREEEVLRASDGIEGVTAELRVTTRVASEAGEQVELQRMFVSPTASAYRIHSSELEANGQRYAVVYPRPAVVLREGARVGERWHVSSEEVAGLEGDTWGEVVGLQDARTPAGLFEQCLVVRYTVELSGTLQVDGAGSFDVTDGTMVVTEWHAKGFGMVLAKEQLSEKLVGTDGTEIVATMEAESALTHVEGLSLPASASE